MRKRTPVIVRLAMKIGPAENNVPDLGPCWPFAGARNAEGYGVIRDDAGKLALAHRIALAARLGRPLEIGKLACHRCDIPWCIRPAHLYEGTKEDNERDKRHREYQRPPNGDTIVFAL